MAGWTQRELSRQSGVSLPTIKRLEAGSGPLSARLDTLRKIQAALEGADIKFIDENGGAPGVRLKRRDSSG